MRLLRFFLLALSITGAFVSAPCDDQLHVHPRYQLRSGDAISLEYRFTPEFNQTAVIQPDGFISLSIGGDIKVSGLTLAQAHDMIVQRAAARLNGPELNVILKEFETPYIAVAGEVDKPGRMAFYEHTTALQAIMLSGGFKETAQQSQVIVFRKVNDEMSKTIQLNLHKVAKTSDLERDLVLEPGDVVLVPRNKLQNVARFVKSVNLGLYLDPLNYVTR
jgi:polysaccharide export outer membrane protein